MAKFKVGDKVRVLNVGAIMFGRKYLENGKVYEVISQGSSGNPRIGDRRHKERGMRVEGLVITPDEFHAIELVKEDANMGCASTNQYRTEKRKAKVGERILITDASSDQIGKNYSNGDVLYVTDDRHSTVVTCGCYDLIFNREYEVIVGENVTLETRVSELEAEVEALKAQLADTPKRVVEYEFVTVKKTPNQRRADVIKRARAFVADLEERAISDISNRDGNTLFNHRTTRLTFHVNAEKGVVTALAHGKHGGQLLGKAFARCAPGDVFNADIGKAIAAGRLYGVKVPSDFLDAPKPTVVVDYMKIVYDGKIHTVTPGSYYEDTHGTKECQADSLAAHEGIIIDDTDAEYA